MPGLSLSAGVHQLPAEVYHNECGEWVSRSELWALRKSPREYEARHVTGAATAKATRAMDLGTMVHAALLEPHLAGDILAKIPEGVLASDGSRRGKKWVEWKEANAGRIALRESEHATALRMCEVLDAFLASHLGRGWRSLSVCEATFLAVEQIRGVAIQTRCRTDLVFCKPGDGRLVIADVKATNDVRAPQWLKTMRRFGYWFQVQHYAEVVRHALDLELVPEFWFLCVRSAPPHYVVAYRLDLPTETAARVREVRDELLVDWHIRTASGDWSDPDENQVVDLDVDLDVDSPWVD